MFTSQKVSAELARTDRGNLAETASPSHGTHLLTATWGPNQSTKQYRHTTYMGSPEAVMLMLR
jgi:hypothetical protein